MKILYTVEEYKQRIIDHALDVSLASIKPECDEITKDRFVAQIVEHCVTNQFMLKEEYNSHFIAVFGYAKDGRKLYDMDKLYLTNSECKEFDSQWWYVDYNAEMKKRWLPEAGFRSYFICNYKKEKVYQRVSDIMRDISLPFQESNYDIIDEIIRLFNEKNGRV